MKTKKRDCACILKFGHAEYCPHFKLQELMTLLRDVVENKRMTSAGIEYWKSFLSKTEGK